MVLFWEDYNNLSSKYDFVLDDRNLAVQVLEAYDIPYTGFIPPYGNLGGIDIKHTSSMSVIQASLAESTAKSGADTIYEIAVNGDGEVEFIEINSNLMDTTDLYFVTEGKLFKYNNISVSVTGKTPLPNRYLSYPYDLFSNGVHLWETSSFLQGCIATSFNRYATITFTDPHIQHSNYKDGVDNLAYNITSPWEKIMTWIWDIDPGDISDLTKVSYSQVSSNLPYLLRGPATGLSSGEISNLDQLKTSNVDMGDLVRRELVSGDPNDICAFISGGSVTCGDGTVPLVLPNHFRYENLRGTIVDKFKDVQGVFLVGWEIDSYYSRPIGSGHSKSPPNTYNSQLVISINDLSKKIIKLREGIHYATGYEYNNLGERKICFQFANNAPVGDHIQYGKPVKYQVHPNCLHRANASSGTGTVFPLDKTSAFLVYQVFALIAVDGPSIVVEDINGHATEIAQNLTAQITALVLNNPPAPLAINGELVDQSELRPDTDPTTIQDFEDTQYERLRKQSDSGPSVDMTISTLDESETIRLSGAMYNLLNSDSGNFATYTFGPSGNPKLGDRTSTGVVNSITYNYNDSGSYTISATTGPILSGGLSGLTGSLGMKKVENVSANGRVIQNEGNGARYKVLVEGYGPVIAYNATPEIIRVGDKVQVTLNNVPLEA